MKNWIVVAATAVLAALLVRACFPRVVERDRVITLPATAETVVVNDTVIQADTVFRDRIRDVLTTDTINLTDTVTITAWRTVDGLNRVFIDTVTVGEFFGDTTYVAGTAIRSDGDSLQRSDIFQRYITLGTLRTVLADSTGIRLDFKEFPDPPPQCNFWCRLQWGVGGAAVGALLTLTF